MWNRLGDLLWRIRLLAARHHINDEAARELDGHLDLLTERYRRLGMSDQEARTAARRQLGSPLAVRQQIHQINSLGWLEDAWSDIRLALRQLRGSPGFTALAALTLALGIGANSAIFALVDATLIRPLPFPEPERLVMVWERTTRAPRSTVAPLNFHDWHDRNRTFDGMAAVFPYSRRLSAADGSVEQVPAQQVTPRFFELLGGRPIAGRTFRPSDVAVPPNVVVLSEGLWRTRYGSDPGLIGRIIQIDAQPFTVVGVVSEHFHGLSPASLWTVWAEIPGMDSRANRFMRVIGRLKRETTRQSAQQDLDRVAADLAREYPAANKDSTGVTIDPLRDAVVGSDLRSTSLLFIAVVGFVLLMCCANVANLLLARTASRARELAVRSALGAGRLRIVRQLLTEGAVLAAVGGVVGLLVGLVILRAAPSLIPQGMLPPTVALAFDVRVVAFCMTTTLVVGIVFGVAPAWQATGMTLVEVLTSKSRGSTKGGGRLRSLLVIAEVAMAVLLLSGAGLLLRTLMALGSLDAGYRAENVLAVQPSIDYGSRTAMFPNENALRQFLERIVREVESLPGVASAAWGTSLPLIGFSSVPFTRVGAQPDSEHGPLLADRQMVSPEYLPMLGIRIVAGRGFGEEDSASALPVCIVSESVARRYFGGNAIGQHLVLNQLAVGPTQPVVREIVGVAADVRRNLDETGESRAIYVPISQNPWSFGVLLVKPTAGPAEALAPSIRAAVARVDKRVPVGPLGTIDDVLRTFIMGRPRFRAAMVTTFATLALILAMVGVFGVLAYSVQQRRREFGVRMALGATTSNVLGLVLGNAGRLIGTGALLGLVSAALFAQSISTFLFGVRPLDPLTFAGVIAVLGATAAIASAIPALRASHVDPVDACRND